MTIDSDSSALVAPATRTCPICLEQFTPRRSYSVLCNVKCQKRWGYLQSVARAYEAGTRDFPIDALEQFLRVREVMDANISARQAAADARRAADEERREEDRAKAYHRAIYLQQKATMRRWQAGDIRLSTIDPHRPFRWRQIPFPKDLFYFPPDFGLHHFS